jgi:hypothetical protein
MIAAIAGVFSDTVFPSGRSAQTPPTGEGARFSSQLDPTSC